MADQLCHFTGHIFWGALVLVLLAFFVQKYVLITLLLLIPVIAVTGFKTLPWYIPVKNEGKAIAASTNPVICIADLNTSMWALFYKDFIKETALINAQFGSLWTKFIQV